MRRFWLLDRRDDQQGVRVFRMRDMREALRLLQASLSDPSEMAGIRRWWGLQYGRVPRDDMALLGEIARAEADGRVVFAEREVWRPQAVPGEVRRLFTQPPSEPARQPTRRPPPPRPRAPTDVPDAPKAPVKTWIEFCLIDDDAEAPVAGVPFKITLTDGTETTKTTDGAGKIRIDGIDPGSCDILKVEAEDAPVVTKVM